MERVRQWSLWELELRAARRYPAPFVQVRVEAELVSPSGASRRLEGFHDGEDRWVVRFTPEEAGEWSFASASWPDDPGLARTGRLLVEPAGPARGFLRVDRAAGWGFRWDSGAPAFLLGDTMYNLFGYAHSGYDAAALLRHRRAQGFDLVRVRAHASTFHHRPSRYFRWQTRDAWPWGGIPQAPLFDEFNLEYFRSADAVLRILAELDMGLELIFEAWMFEFPFNDRARFTAEDEELWIRYLVARYGAFRSLYLWTTANEYVYYPGGHRRLSAWDQAETLPDRWSARLARLVKSVDAHRHPVAVHTMDLPAPTYAERLRGYPEIDVILFQEWGLRDERAWTAAGIDAAIRAQVANARQVPVLAEYGYESVLGLPTIEMRRFMHRDHNRRGAWRGCFSGVLVVTGFENTWGPFMTLDHDAEGAGDFLHLRRFFEELAPFAALRPLDGLASGGRPDQEGGGPLALATDVLDLVAVYVPLGGPVVLQLPEALSYRGEWFDPRSGRSHAAAIAADGAVAPPPAAKETDDWVLLVRRGWSP